MAILGRAKYKRARESSRRRDAKGYFVHPTIAIAKIRDYSQSILDLTLKFFTFFHVKTGSRNQPPLQTAGKTYHISDQSGQNQGRPYVKLFTGSTPTL